MLTGREITSNRPAGGTRLEGHGLGVPACTHKQETRAVTTMLDTPQVKTLRADLTAKAAGIDALANSWKTEGGKLVITTEQHDQYKQAVADAEMVKSLLDDAETAAGLNAHLAEPTGVPAAGWAAANEQRAADREVKTLGDYFTASDQFAAAKGNPRPFIQFTVDRSIADLRAASQFKDVYAGTGGTQTLPGIGRVQELPMRELRLRQHHVRDLFPSGTTNAAVLYGIRETGFTNAARAVPQRENADGTPNSAGAVFGKKPRSSIQLTPVLYNVATIAHLIDAHRNILDDEPRLRDFLNRRMTDGVMLAEDNDILWADGTGESVVGFFNTPGLQTFTGSSADPYTAQIRRAATRVELAEYSATGIIVHPLDWEALELETDNEGRYRLAVSVAVGGEKRVWTMDVIPTTAMTQGQYLLGAFGMGSMFYDRETVNVTVSTENADNYERNVVTFRAESRGALEVFRPESHVAGTFTTPV